MRHEGKFKRERAKIDPVSDNMKSALTLIYVSFYAVISCLAIEPMGHQGSWGGGEHFAFDPDQWDGREQIVTSLRKGSDTIVFVRTSKGEFEVRKELPQKEVFFRFSTKMEAMSPGLRWAVMVDFIQTENMASVLMLGDRGYYYIHSSTAPPKTEPPIYYLPPTILKLGKWMPRYTCGPLDFYYSEDHGGVEGGIKKVVFKNTNEIEFERLLEKNSGKTVRDVFLINENSFLKNGTKIEDVPYLCGVHLIGRFNVDNFAKILHKDVKIEDIKQSLSPYAEEEILELVPKLEDKDLREKVSRIITSAYAENR